MNPHQSQKNQEKCPFPHKGKSLNTGAQFPWYDEPATQQNLLEDRGLGAVCHFLERNEPMKCKCSQELPSFPKINVDVEKLCDVTSRIFGKRAHYGDYYLPNIIIGNASHSKFMDSLATCLHRKSPKKKYKNKSPLKNKQITRVMNKIFPGIQPLPETHQAQKQTHSSQPDGVPSVDKMAKIFSDLGLGSPYRLHEDPIPLDFHFTSQQTTKFLPKGRKLKKINHAVHRDRMRATLPSFQVDHDKLLEWGPILRKPFASRTDHERRAVHQVLKLIPHFQTFSSVNLRRICENMYYHQVEAGEKVFSHIERDERTIFVLSGRLGAYLIKNSIRVKQDEFHSGRVPRLSYGSCEWECIAEVESHLMIIATEELEEIEHSNVMQGEFGELVRILQGNPITRSNVDVDYLYRSLRNMACFHSMSDYLVQRLCGVMRHEYLPRDRVVFRQGDAGTAWFSILRGNLSVYIRNKENNQNVKVAELETGQSFGEMAIAYDTPRRASILTCSPTDLIRVDKDDYNRTLRFVHEKEIKSILSFLKHVTLFREYTRRALRAIAASMNEAIFSAGDTLLEEGKPSKGLFFIRSGICHVYKKLYIGVKQEELLQNLLDEGLTVNNWQSVEVYLGSYTVNDYFGEEAGIKYIQHQGQELVDSNADFIRSSITVIAASDVTVCKMASAEAMFHFLNKLVLSPYCKYSQENLRVRYNSMAEKKEWEKVKTKEVIAMLREKYHDPQMSLEIFNERHSKSIWRC